MLYQTELTPQILERVARLELAYICLEGRSTPLYQTRKRLHSKKPSRLPLSGVHSRPESNRAIKRMRLLAGAVGIEPTSTGSKPVACPSSYTPTVRGVALLIVFHSIHLSRFFTREIYSRSIQLVPGAGLEPARRSNGF